MVALYLVQKHAVKVFVGLYYSLACGSLRVIVELLPRHRYIVVVRATGARLLWFCPVSSQSVCAFLPNLHAPL